MHEALQQALRGPDTFADATRNGAVSGALKRLVTAFSARAIHFFAHRQVEHNVAVVRAVEAAVRALDACDRRLEATNARLSTAESRIEELETGLRTVRAAEDDARRKLALLGIRLREIVPRAGVADSEREDERR
jgi:hypothetical protein